MIKSKSKKVCILKVSKASRDVLEMLSTHPARYEDIGADIGKTLKQVKSIVCGLRRRGFDVRTIDYCAYVPAAELARIADFAAKYHPADE